jgi:mannose-6-phosphate isomerase-like protein (cupin superfamily)
MNTKANLSSSAPDSPLRPARCWTKAANSCARSWAEQMSPCLDAKPSWPASRWLPERAPGRHTHPGDEISYVLEGHAELLIDGQPPRIVKAGESFVFPAGIVHDAHNAGDVPIRLIGVYVVEKGKPLATPAP